MRMGVNKKISMEAYLVVRAERVELSSSVWKTDILAAVLCSQYTFVALGVGYRDRTDDLLDHNQTL